MDDATTKVKLINDIDTMLDTVKGKLFVLSDEVSQSEMETETVSNRVLNVVQRHKDLSLYECQFHVNTDVPESQLVGIGTINYEVAILVHLGLFKSAQERRECLVTEEVVTPICMIIH